MPFPLSLLKAPNFLFCVALLLATLLFSLPCLPSLSPLVPSLYTTHYRWKPLNEIDAGMCDGLTYEEIEERHPEEVRGLLFYRRSV